MAKIRDEPVHHPNCPKSRSDLSTALGPLSKSLGSDFSHANCATVYPFGRSVFSLPPDRAFGSRRPRDRIILPPAGRQPNFPASRQDWLRASNIGSKRRLRNHIELPRLFRGAFGFERPIDSASRRARWRTGTANQASSKCGSMIHLYEFPDERIIQPECEAIPETKRCLRQAND